MWGNRRIGDISKKDVTDAIDAIVKRGTPSAANHAFAAARGLFNWAVERGSIDRSPCEKLGLPTKATSRDRVLSEPEVVAVWNGADAIGFPFGRIVQLLLLTGQRRDEVAGLPWSELDLDQGLWSLPAERTKPGRPHQVPLSQKAIVVLRSVPVTHDTLVFPARGS